MRNAIANVCLAGSSLRDKNHRRKVLSHLDSPEWASTGRFCIAFRDSLGFRHDFRALYAFQRDSSFGFILFQLCVWVMDVCVAQQQHCVHFLISKIDFRSSIGRFVRVVSTYPAPRELSEAMVSKSYSLHCFLVA